MKHNYTQLRILFDQIIFQALLKGRDRTPYVMYHFVSVMLRSKSYILIYSFQIQKHQRHRKAKCFEAQFSERANVSLQRQELWRGQTNCVWPIYGSKPPQTNVNISEICSPIIRQHVPNSCTLVRIMDLNQYLEKMITNTIVI